MRASGFSVFVAMGFWMVLSFAGFAQDANLTPQASSAVGKTRLKIGVALEGGGALGLAHIGVLQSLEDQHIPIDYLAGTSMGGLVGGLYALGRSPQELEKIVQAQDWDFIIAGEQNYQDLSYRRKEDARAYPNLLRFGLKHGLSLPSGLNAGQGVSALIDQETLAYAHTGSFDDFPTPFRCVATNLVTDQPHVFDHGSIARALRATMSIPGVFAPVRDGNNLYVDGSLMSNLPSSVVRDMGADIVIAVHLETPPTNPEEIRSMFSVLGRSIEAVIRANELKGMADADLVISVPLSDFNSLDYNKSAAIIARGKAAADAKSRVLAPYRLNDADWNAYTAQRKSRVKTTVPTPEFVEVQGVINPEATRHLRVYLDPLVGKPVNAVRMQSVLSQLTGNGRYDSANYWIEEKNGAPGLIVNVHEKINEPPTLQLGFDVDGSEPNWVTFTQTGRLTYLDVAGFRSEWRTDFSFGNNYGISSELYRPFNAQAKWFFAPHAEAYNDGLRIFQKRNAIAFYRVNLAAIGIDLGYTFSRFTQFRGGYDAGYSYDNLNLGTPDFASVSGRIGNTHLNFFTDHTDDPVVPSTGYLAAVNFHFYDAYPGATNTLPALDVHLQGFHPVSTKGSIFAGAEGGSTFGFGNTGTPVYFLGEPLRLSAYGTNELYGDQYYLFRAGYLHDIFSLPPFVGRKVYAVGAYEFAKMYDFPRAESGFPNDVVGGVLAETAFGPLFFGASFGDTGHRKWFFEVGRAF